ncbi:hypothetical protein BMW24_018650 [Mycobacterium heckeshornense]|uniref:Anti-sigma-M factor RsmA n=2 Tax=Mycobacterium heckeshornense TaxID=110505 RepID=A0A2G8B3T8_9MYCO|nr:hypothetical protein [Mycobacterium heckeshornense]KMV22653.1 hypothetical protein ACT16_10315 [Mycobacterium heckeshornense]MCV7034317.1 hypothetical protein [Mycobacterium heckeshornense]PIJ32400.1 hypothetical protein BMW24_018650 [Mycobacterium heckeshornense]BCO38396.1 anti-sigma-M factor RsmA [Mycobacterium heckeshornense]BCQ11241.1 anti-sigma-M factor RsmA [Mycobacterium heckeshornense]
MDSNAGGGERGTDPPLTVELLADLQAGLLDDDEAARVRERIRADPQAQRAMRALNAVRSDLAALGAEPQSAPQTPPPVVARITAGLRSAAAPAGRAHAAHALRPQLRPVRTIAAVAGVGAAVAAIGLGTAALVRNPSLPSAPTTAQHITVSRPSATLPLAAPEILDLLVRSPDYGPLGDPVRRASCLTGLGYPGATRVLGARPVDVGGRPAVLLVLPADTPDRVAVLAVAPNCSAADTGLLANTVVRRP